MSQMSEVALDAQERLMLPIQAQGLHSIYNFRDEDVVHAFLAHHDYLVPLLVDAYGWIQTFFPNSDVYVELLEDPEMVDDCHVVVFISTDLPVGTAMRHLDRLGEQWWLDVLPEARGKLAINLEFV